MRPGCSVARFARPPIELRRASNALAHLALLLGRPLLGHCSTSNAIEQARVAGAQVAHPGGPPLVLNPTRAGADVFVVPATPGA